MRTVFLTSTVILLLIFGARTGSGQEHSSRLTVRIVAVADGPWDRNQEFFDELRGILNEVLGDRIVVAFSDGGLLEGDWTLEGVRSIDDRLLNDPRVDLILGMGVMASQDLSTRGPLPKPVIAPVVLDPARQKIPLKDGVSGIKNLSYLVFPTTFQRDIELFREIVPFTKLVYVASARYMQALPSMQVSMEEIGKNMGLHITAIYVDSSADEVLRELPGDAEAVYIEPILHLPRADFSKLVAGFIERRLPSFSFLGESEVRQGIMAGANPDFFPRLARRIALNIQRILASEEPGSLSVRFPAGRRLFFNFQTMYAVGVTPSWNTLLESELVQLDTTSVFAQHFTLKTAVERVLEGNLDLQAKVREVNANAENVVIARSSLLPSVDLSATGYQIDKDRALSGFQPERTALAEIGVSQLLFSEPALANLSIRSSLQDSKEGELEETRLNTIVSGATKYLDLLRSKKIFVILLDNLKITRKNLELAEIRQSTGAAGEEEPLRWKAEIANAKKAVLAVHSQWNQARYAFNQALNLQLTQPLDVADVSLDDSTFFISDKRLAGYFGIPMAFDILTEYMVAQGLKRAPELRQLDAVIDAQARALTSTRISYIAPTVSFFGSYNKNFYNSGQNTLFSTGSVPPPPTGLDPNIPEYLGRLLAAVTPQVPDRNNWTVGIRLSLNLFSGFSKRALEVKASEQLSQYRFQRQSVADKVELRIRSEMQNAKSSHFAIQQSQLEQEAALKTLNIVTEAYSRGAVSILNVLDAQNSALRANQVAANALYDFFVVYMQLQRSLGQFDLLMTPQEREDFRERALQFMEMALRR